MDEADTKAHFFAPIKILLNTIEIANIFVPPLQIVIFEQVEVGLDDLPPDNQFSKQYLSTKFADGIRWG